MSRELRAVQLIQPVVAAALCMLLIHGWDLAPGYLVALGLAALALVLARMGLCCWQYARKSPGGDETNG